jgi:hypothetical protein
MIDKPYGLQNGEGTVGVDHIVLITRLNVARRVKPIQRNFKASHLPDPLQRRIGGSGLSFIGQRITVFPDDYIF